MRKLPFLKILLPFIIGIALQQFAFPNYANNFSVWLVGFLLLVFMASTFLKTFFVFKFPYVYGFTVFGIITAMGFTLSKQQQSIKHANHYSNFVTDSSVFTAVVQQPIIQKTKSYKTTIAITNIQNGNISKAVQGNLLCYFTQATKMSALIPGAVFVFQTKLLPIKNNGNIGEFDYKSFCANKNILHSCFVNTFSYLPTGIQKNSLISRCSNWRIATIQRLKKYITNPNALGIAEALLIGDRTDIDQDTWDSYSRTGIVHIIAISGMHMGIIYIGILGLLGFLPWFKKQKKLCIIIAVICMWIFACVTGLPASVMRAAVMFTILAGSALLNRESFGFNSLLVSAFILLVYNTRWLQDVGFQLSYAAVLGIMLFAKPIQNILFIKNKYLLAVWKLVSGTLAAQIFTFPLCLYYFHQFPLIFLISNIIAIPLTSIILYLEIALLVFTFISAGISIVIGKLVTALILFLNKAIYWLSTFKNITIYNVHCNAWQAGFLFAFVCLAIVASRTKKSMYAFASLGMLLIFYAIQINVFWKARTQQKMVIHHVPKASIISYIKGNSYALLSPSTMLQSDIKNAVEPSLLAFSAATLVPTLVHIMQVDSNYLLASTPTTNLLVLGKNADSIQHVMPCKYVVLTKNCKMSIDKIQQFLTPKCIIADGTNGMWKIEQWQKEAKDLHLQFFSTQLQGAFVADL